MGESRQELLAWLNNLLQLNVTRVEQCGSGAALCQVFDSIFLDVPMGRVKFNVNNEYGYLQNFKILQNTFAKHAIDRPVPVESLIKCKMQDNLEFLQWSKRYWDQHFPGVDYDPVARRKGAGTAGPGAPSSFSASRSSTGSGATAPRRAAPVPSNSGAARAPRVAAGGAAAPSAALLQQNNELKESVAGLERERDFYFDKLRQIEVMLQEEVAAHPELEQDENGMIPRMQAILYSTEDGFEIPADEDGEFLESHDGLPAEEETF